jgi:hypothetical protein
MLSVNSHGKHESTTSSSKEKARDTKGGKTGFNYKRAGALPSQPQLTFLREVIYYAQDRNLSYDICTTFSRSGGKIWNYLSCAPLSQALA